MHLMREASWRAPVLWRFRTGRVTVIQEVSCAPSAIQPQNCVDTLRGAGMFSGSDSRGRRGKGWLLPHETRIGQRDLRNDMKRQYQPSKIRRKRQHGFLNRNSSKSGRATLRNRRRAGRRRLTPV